MPPPTAATPVASFAYAALAGVASHHAFFRHGELMHLTRHIFLGILFSPPALFAYYRLSAGLEPAAALGTAAAVWSGFLAGLGASILAYRAFFHPLRRFPGPFAARLSGWYAVSIAASGLHYQQYLLEQHRKHGDVVRTAPNKLSIVVPEAAQPLSLALKGPAYDFAWPHKAINSTRDVEAHRLRRRAWDRAFTRAAVASYVPHVEECVDNLVACLRALSAAAPAVDLVTAVNWFAYDAMGYLVFGKSFNMTASRGRDGQWVDSVHGSMRLIGYFAHVPWLMQVMTLVPGSARLHERFMGWVGAMLEERKAREAAGETKKLDLLTQLLQAEPANLQAGPHGCSLVEDTRIGVIAGSDTTAATLQAALLHLAGDEEQQEKLYREITAASQLDKTPDLSNSKLPYLDGVINEALRLYPALPSGLERMSPPEGLEIGGHKIPPGVALAMPPFVTGRDERYWEQAEKFLPERWISDAPEFARSRTIGPKVFLSFWLGRYGCVGKPLAFLEMRMALAKIVANFRFRLLSGTAEEIMRGTRDVLTTLVPSAQVTFVEREA